MEEKDASMGTDDRTIALTEARSSVLRASAVIHGLREVCTRARACIENAPEAEKLDEAVRQLERAHRAAQAAVEAAQGSITRAADVIAGRVRESGVRDAQRKRRQG